MARLFLLACYQKIFAIASSKRHDYLRSLGATHLFDYNSPSLINDINTAVGGPGKDPVLKEKLMPVILPELLEKELIQPTCFRLTDQGNLQQRVEQALDLFRNSKVSGEKLVIKID
ncbi:hypothetical protein AN958_07605 [Leucoagaricus sp. SymC.cos]|nr:hypothetical protein AN958_07605 [Leucoagaricus sp. SymC.cos]